MRRQRKSSIILALSVWIAIIVWSQMGMYLCHILFGVDIKVNFFRFCLSLFRENSLYYFLVITLLNITIAYTFILSFIKMIQQYVLSKKLKTKLMGMRNITLTANLIQQFQPLNQHMIVIDHGQAMAFTAGIRRPLIVLSSALVEMLDDQELEAVIAHEIYHQNHYDSLKIFLLQLIARSLWFIPLTKWSYYNYKMMSELLADEHAIQYTGSEIGLGSALLKLIKNNFSDNPTPVLVHFSDGIVNYRLQQLVDPQSSIPLKLDAVSLVISIQVMLLIICMNVLAIT